MFASFSAITFVFSAMMRTSLLNAGDWRQDFRENGEKRSASDQIMMSLKASARAPAEGQAQANQTSKAKIKRPSGRSLSKNAALEAKKQILLSSSSTHGEWHRSESAGRT